MVRSVTMRTALLAAPLAALLAAGAPAAAAAQSGQGARDADPASAIAETQAVADRIEREWACIRNQHRQLVRTVALLREARVQMGRSPSGSRAHEDAKAAVRSLRQRALELERAALACRTEPSERARSESPPEGVSYVTAPVDPTARAVAERNPATRVIERDVLLHGSAKAVVGEQVDGAGRIDAAVIRSAVRGVGARLSRCYDRLVDRGALQRGTIILTFTVQPNGRVTGIRTERNTLGSDSFARCLRAAARGIRPSRGATGGEATIAYTLQFPAG